MAEQSATTAMLRPPVTAAAAEVQEKVQAWWAEPALRAKSLSPGVWSPQPSPSNCKNHQVSLPPAGVMSPQAPSSMPEPAHLPPASDYPVLLLKTVITTKLLP